MKRVLYLVWILPLVLVTCTEQPQAASSHTPPVATSMPSVQLTLWHAYGGTLGEQFEALVDEFNRLHPGIAISSSYGGDLWTMRDKLFTAIAGGGGPDLAQIDQFWSSELAEAGAILRIQDRLDKVDQDDFWPLAWETATFGGEIWTMPFSLSSIVLYYNRALFAAAGLDPEDPPATWGELATAAAALTADADGDGANDRWGLSFPVKADDGVVYYWFAFLWQAGGEIFSGDYATSRFHEVPGIQALDYWQTLVQEGDVPLAPPENGFETGQIAMLLSSTARLSRYVTVLGDDLGVAPLPAGPAGRATGVGGANLAVFASTKHPDAAWTFVDWMTSPEINLRWSTGTGYLPLRRSVVASEAFQAYLREEPRARVSVAEIEFARARPNIPAYAGASREIGLAIEQALFSGADSAVALAAAAEKVDAILAQSR